MNLPDEMVDQLANLCYHRWHSCLEEGKTEQQAFEELARTILETYIEALAS